MFKKALAAFFILPGSFGGLVPIAAGISDPWRGSGHSLGFIVVAIGLAALAWCVRDFYVTGKGTLAPWAPPVHLVVVGLYRHTRNPMYLGVLLIISGFAILFTSPLVAIYCALVAIILHVRVIFSEEKRLASQFGEEWIRYKKEVPRWIHQKRPIQREHP